MIRLERDERQKNGAASNSEAAPQFNAIALAGRAAAL
jgi:hypothetical protein